MSIVFILTIAAFWYFKRVSFEAQLKAMNWIIEPDDLFSMEEFGIRYKQLKRDRHKVNVLFVSSSTMITSLLRYSRYYFSVLQCIISPY